MTNGGNLKQFLEFYIPYIFLFFHSGQITLFLLPEQDIVFITKTKSWEK